MIARTEASKIGSMPGKEAADEAEDERPKCAGCGEPIELAYTDDPQSWIHAADANYFGDHSAWLEEELS